MRLPSVRTTCIALTAIAVIGFFAIGNYWPRGGLVANIMRGELYVGDFIVPYRWLIVMCVALAAARIAVDRPEAKRPE